MTFKRISPPEMAEPIFNAYSHGIVIPPGCEVLFSSGQVGNRKDGTLPPDFGDQTRQVWDNILAILKAADMAVTDIIKVTQLIVGKDNFPKYVEIRKGYLAGHSPAMTGFFVPALVKPEMLVEVEIIAAKKR
ncbi:MAG: RidA family protein [Alphaproteobacteria bacterium]|nr:RidA family protein [Alphaproteobacteria bacterium]